MSCRVSAEQVEHCKSMPAGDVGSLQRSWPVTSAVIIERLRFHSSCGCPCMCYVGLYLPLLLLSISQHPQARCQTLAQKWAIVLTRKGQNLTFVNIKKTRRGAVWTPVVTERGTSETRHGSRSSSEP